MVFRAAACFSAGRWNVALLRAALLVAMTGPLLLRQ